MASYSFDDVPGDWDLEHFDTQVGGPSVQRKICPSRAQCLPRVTWPYFDCALSYGDPLQVSHDQVAIIPLIKRALATAEASGLAKRDGRPMRLFGSPWSPPAWLKAAFPHYDPATGEFKGSYGSMDGSANPQVCSHAQ